MSSDNRLYQKQRILRPLFGLLLPMVLLGALLGVVACSQATEAEEDPYLRYRPAMKNNYQDHFDEIATAPRYDITVDVDAAGEQLTGTMRLLFYNTTPDTLSEIIFRLYPTLRHYQGGMAINSAAVNGQPITFVYVAENTALQLNLRTPLQPDTTAEIELGWRLQIPSWPDSANVYALFGRSQQMLSLPLFYPSLAIYQPGLLPDMGRWWLEQGTSRGDAAFNVASLFVVTATLPAEQVPVASGVLISSTLVSNQRARHVWVTGPSREFILHMSPLFRSAATFAGGTRIISYWLPGDEAAGRAALQYAISAVRIFSERFGPYPYTEMRVAPAPLTFRGMEYPQVNLLGVQLYRDERENLETLVAHEVAHQWWYQLVHNDPINTPWLDEALAEYAVKLYYGDLYGEGEAAFLQKWRWENPLATLREEGDDAQIGGRVDSFVTGRQYETVTYGKGALFYDQVRRILGDRPFNRFLQGYLERHRYQIVNEIHWSNALQALEDPEINRLYDAWIHTPRLAPTEQASSQ